MNQIERAFLGSLIVDGSQAWAMERTRPEYFTSEPARRLFSFIAERVKTGRPLDLALCWDELQRLDLLAVWQECQASEFAAGLLSHYLTELRKSHAERTITRILASKGSELAEQDKIEIRRLIDESEMERAFAGITVGDRMAAVLDQIAESYGKKPELPFGITALDELTAGLHPGELTTVGGYAGSGKTTLVTFYAFTIASRGVPILYFSTEISSDQFIKMRLLPLASGVHGDLIRKNRIGPEDKDIWRKLTEGGSIIGSQPFHLNDLSSPSLGDIRYAIRTLRPRCIFVDYLGRCKMPRAENRVLQVNEFVKGLKNIARDEGISVIAAAQLNRESQQSNTAPQLKHLRESGAIEQESDNVMLLHQPDPAFNCFELIIAKNRWGECGIVHIHRDAKTLAITSCPMPGGCADRPLHRDRMAASR